MTEQYFTGLYEAGCPTPPDRAQQHNLWLVERGSEFNRAIDDILAKDPRTGKYALPVDKILPALDEAYVDFNDRFHGLSSRELMRFFNAFMDLKAHQRMIDLYKKSDNPDFKNAPIVAERLAVALNMLKRPSEAIEWAQRALQDDELIKAGLSKAEMFGALGKAYSLRQLATEDLLKDRQNANAIGNYRAAFGLKDSDPIAAPGDLEKQAARALIESKNAYEKGFLDGFAYYPGINAVYSDIALGNLGNAQKNAELVYLATLRDGGLESADYWTVTTMVESLCILGKGHEQSFQAALHRVAGLIRDIPEWRLESTFGKWDTVLKPALLKLSTDEKYGQAASEALQRCEEAERYLMAAHTGANFTAAAAETTQSAGSRLLAKSHGYRGQSIFDAEMVTNNFSFGGLISHVLITRRDRHEFHKLLSLPVGEFVDLLRGDPTMISAKVDLSKPLWAIDDASLFIETAQKLIRQNFGTETKKMEIIDDPDRFQAFDETTKALDFISGAPVGMDARTKTAFDYKTSVAAEFAKGIGDCRHHAQSLQLMFDVWQENKLSEYLRTAHGTETPTVREDALAAFKELERIRLRTIDVQILAPIKVKEPYRPERPVESDIASPGFVLDTKNNFVESHTMNVLFRLSAQNQIEEAALCCAFYQKVYPWANMPIDPTFIRTTLDGDGNPRFEIPAGYLDNVQGAMTKKAPVTIVSEGYSGQRTRISSDDPGSIFERGHVCNTFDIVDALHRRNQQPDSYSPFGSLLREKKRHRTTYPK